jgi:hypothetical protein
VRLSLGGQPWPELELHAGHGELARGEGEGGEEAGGLATGALGRQGRSAGGGAMGTRPARGCFFVLNSC